MANFERINYDRFLDYLEEAEEHNRILKGYHTVKEQQQFVKDNKIDDYVIALKMAELGPDTKKVIIKNGLNKGYYIFSWYRDRPNDNFAFKFKSDNNSKTKTDGWW